MAKRKKTSTPRRTTYTEAVCGKIAKRARQNAIRSTYKKNGGIF